MTEKYKPSQDIINNTHINADQYEKMYQESINQPDHFWAENGKRIDWIKPYSKISNFSYDLNNLSIKWFEDGTLNASYNCIDRHVLKNGNKTAIIWEGDDPQEQKIISYNDLLKEVSKFSNVLKELGVNEIAVNVHHLKQKISSYINKNHTDIKVFEEEVILDTGGALVNAKHFLSEDYFLVLNSDTVWQKNYILDMKTLIKNTIQKKFLAGLLLARKEKSFDPNLNADFFIAGEYLKNHALSIKDSLYKNIVESKSMKYLGSWDQKTFLENLYNYDVFVLPSFGEGIPLAALEAMASGRALICSDVPGCNSCVIDNKNGYLCEQRSSQSLTQSMQKIIYNKNQILKMGEYSRKIVENGFELDLIYKKYLHVIKA